MVGNNLLDLAFVEIALHLSTVDTLGLSGQAHDPTRASLAGHQPFLGIAARRLVGARYAVVAAGHPAYRALLAWETDGTRNGTKEIGVDNAHEKGLQPTSFVSLNNKLLFQGRNAANHVGLWQTDGTPGGTNEITIDHAAAGGLLASIVFWSGLLNDRVLFQGTNAANRIGLWETDGTRNGTKEIPVEQVGAKGLQPQYFAVLNNKLLFVGTNAALHVGLWETDGTADGTFEIPFISTYSLLGHLTTLHFTRLRRGR
jgi:hypothetical protein